MASATITYHLAEHDHLDITVDTASTSPDALTDVTNRARTLFTAALTDVMQLAREPTDDTTS